jgi:hypothetical protein
MSERICIRCGKNVPAAALAVPTAAANRSESCGGIAEIPVDRIAGLKLKCVQSRVSGAFSGVACVAFCECCCLDAADLGAD